jgi:DNA-binding transcriptional LysR family regulator
LIVDTNFRDPWHWPFLDQQQQLHSQPVRGKMKFSNAEICLAAACAGLGIARLPFFIARKALDERQVVPVLAAYEARRWRCSPCFRPRAIWRINHG